MSAVLEASGLTKRYGRRVALDDCTIAIPEGHVVGLVGPNGAGKSTLLNLAAGLLTPTSGSIQTAGDVPGSSAAQLARVGFVAQDNPLYRSLSVADHLRLGQRTNPAWDSAFAAARIEELGLAPDQRAGGLSGGQRAQLALTLALAKRPQLLLLDEPVASLDPLARREFLQLLMDAVVGKVSVVLSSHLVSDVERVCDFVIVIVGSRVQVAGDVDELVASHHRLIGPRAAQAPENQEVIDQSHTDGQSILIVRSDGPVLDSAWTIESIGLEDIVLAYMSRGRVRGTTGRDRGAR